MSITSLFARLQLHAYIIQISEYESNEDFWKRILVYNEESCSLEGSFLGANQKNGYVTFNCFKEDKEIDSTSLNAILNNFIAASVKTKTEFESIFSEGVQVTHSNPAPIKIENASSQFLMRV